MDRKSLQGFRNHGKGPQITMSRAQEKRGTWAGEEKSKRGREGGHQPERVVRNWKGIKTKRLIGKKNSTTFFQKRVVTKK